MWLNFDPLFIDTEKTYYLLVNAPVIHDSCSWAMMECRCRIDHITHPTGKDISTCAERQSEISHRIYWSEVIEQQFWNCFIWWPVIFERSGFAISFLRTVIRRIFVVLSVLPWTYKNTFQFIIHWHPLNGQCAALAVTYVHGGGLEYLHRSPVSRVEGEVKGNPMPEGVTGHPVMGYINTESLPYRLWGGGRRAVRLPEWRDSEMCPGVRRN
jgi:hypothetical protein